MTENKYKERCNDPAKYAEWRGSGLVQLRTLSKGDVFESIDGDFWTRDRDGACGTVWAIPSGRDGESQPFVATAMVRPVVRKTYVEPTP